jgi:hypothetical protein
MQWKELKNLDSNSRTWAQGPEEEAQDAENIPEDTNILLDWGMPGKQHSGGL